MNGEQYEELCRLYIANNFELGIEHVRSLKVPNPQRPDLAAYEHQIDLFWETGNELARYLNIANAKWRGSAKVDQPDVLLLQQVRQQVAAHKAFMITNHGYTSGARAAAEDHGIALHVVTPSLDEGALPGSDRVAIQTKLKELESSDRLYSHRVELRGADPSPNKSRPSPSTQTSPIQTRIVNPPSTTGMPSTPRQTPGREETRGGGSRRGGKSTR